MRKRVRDEVRKMACKPGQNCNPSQHFEWLVSSKFKSCLDKLVRPRLKTGKEEGMGLGMWSIPGVSPQYHKNKPTNKPKNTKEEKKWLPDRQYKDFLILAKESDSVQSYETSNPSVLTFEIISKNQLYKGLFRIFSLDLLSKC